MKICEILYQKGYISYPRTETAIFPAGTDFTSLIQTQCSNPWSDYATRLLNENGFALNLSYCGRCGEPIKNKVFLSSREGICVCENCRKEGDGGFSVDTYKYVSDVSEGVFSDVEPKIRRNGLKLFGYYIEKVSGVALKSLSEFIEILNMR